MNDRNLTNLDIACKDCLTQVLRPQLFTVIEPWMNTATTKEKRQVCSLAKIARGGVHTDCRNATTVNVYGKSTPLNHNHQGLDRIQSELYMKQCNADEINKPLERRRLHFQQYEPILSGPSVRNYFSLNNSPLKKEPYAKLLNSKSQQALEKWQCEGYHNDHFRRAEVVQTLRNLDRGVNSLSTYPVHMSRNPKLTIGSRLFQYSQKIDWVPPLRRTESMPEVSQEPVQLDPRIAKIKEPGGYRVELQDPTKIQFMKNHERSRQCKVTMMGGSGAYQSTTHASYPDWTAT